MNILRFLKRFGSFHKKYFIYKKDKNTYYIKKKQ